MASLPSSTSYWQQAMPGICPPTAHCQHISQTCQDKPREIINCGLLHALCRPQDQGREGSEPLRKPLPGHDVGDDRALSRNCRNLGWQVPTGVVLYKCGNGTEFPQRESATCQRCMMPVRSPEFQDMEPHCQTALPGQG